MGYTHGGPWLEQLKAYIDGNLALVERFLKERIPGARFAIPEATYFAWVDLSGVLPQVDDLPDDGVRPLSLHRVFHVDIPQRGKELAPLLKPAERRFFWPM